MNDELVFLAIHVLVPAIGVFIFARLCVAMRDAHVENPPYRQLFVLFATYGGVLLVVLTALFWRWSGMASLGVFYLLLAAPVAMAVCAWSVDPKQSAYHTATFKAAVLYYVLWLPSS